jgi:hypothetical protein
LLFKHSRNTYFTESFYVYFLAGFNQTERKAPKNFDSSIWKISITVNYYFWCTPFCSLRSLFDLFCLFRCDNEILMFFRSCRWIYDFITLVITPDLHLVSQFDPNPCSIMWNKHYNMTVLLCDYYLRYVIYWAFRHWIRHWFQSLDAQTSRPSYRNQFQNCNDESQRSCVFWFNLPRGEHTI